MRISVVVVAAIMLAGPAAAANPSAGRLIAQRECGACHAVGLRGDSPLADAPRFRDLRPKVTREQLALKLIDRLLIGHPRMPRLRLDPDETSNLLDYWESLPQPPRERAELASPPHRRSR